MKTDISAGSKHDRNFAVLMSLSQIPYPAQKVWNHSYNIFQHSDLMPRSDNWELAITSAIPPAPCLDGIKLLRQSRTNTPCQAAAPIWH